MRATEPYITYSPLVDASQCMTGVHLRVHCGSLTAAAVASQLNALSIEWPTCFTQVLVELASLEVEVWPTSWRPAPSTVLVTRSLSLLADPDFLALVEDRPKVCLVESGVASLEGLDVTYIGAAAKELSGWHWPAGAANGMALVGLDCDEPIEQVYAGKHGAIAWSGWSCMQWKRKPADRKVGMLSTLLKLVQMIDRDADTADIEAILKRDAPLSYKLIALANSAAYGLAVEVTSVKHAINIVGRAKLKRWLALMLVQSGGDTPQVLIKTAFVRASFLQAIGSALEIDGEKEDLFLCGAFSLLDRILGIPMGDVLSRVSISDAITDALMDGSGALGPLIELMHAVENREPNEVSRLCDELSIGPMDVNQALLSAVGSAAASSET